MAAWVVPAITAAGSAISALASSSGGGGNSGSNGYKPKVLNQTDSTTQSQEQVINYFEPALAVMDEMAQQIGEFADGQENFLTDVYQPVQEQMLNANEVMIPAMEKLAGDALELMTTDLMSNSLLGDILKSRAASDSDPNSFVNRTFKQYETEIAKLPTEQERVGQAIASVEHQFKGAGKNLARDFASRGQSVSQASSRDLAIQKATAKAGAAGKAGADARAERLNKMERGVTMGLQKNAQEANTTNQQVQGLLGLQQGQVGALNAKQGLFDTDKVDTLGARGQQVSLVGQRGVMQRGTSTQADSLSHTQKGLNKAPKVTDDGLVLDKRKITTEADGSLLNDNDRTRLDKLESRPTTTNVYYDNQGKRISGDVGGVGPTGQGVPGISAAEGQSNAAAISGMIGGMLDGVGFGGLADSVGDVAGGSDAFGGGDSADSGQK